MGLLSSISKRVSARIDPLLHPAFGREFAADPIAVYDIGAAGGVYCPIEGGPGPCVHVFAFEPVKRSYDELARRYAGNPYVQCREVALAGHDGVATLNIVEGGETWSSLYSRQNLNLNSRPIEVKAVRLDSVPSQFSVPAPDVLKLDTEGSEVLILDAGPVVLAREVLGVVVEVSFWRRDADGAVFSDLDRLMTGAGFVLFDMQINRAHVSGIGGKKDKIRTADALYLRDFEQFVDKSEDKPEEWRRMKLLKLVCLCVAWRYMNYALELVDYGKRLGLLTADEFSVLSNIFASTTDISTRVPDFPGRPGLARLFDRLSFALHRKPGKGVPALFNELGNRWVVSRRRSGGAEAIEIYKPVIGSSLGGHIKTITIGNSRI